VQEEGQGGAAQRAGVFQALAQGHAPMLETLQLKGWTPETVPLQSLGLALTQGKLPRLANIDMGGCKFGSADLQALVDGLQATPKEQLSILHIYDLKVSETDWEYLGRAIEAKGSGLAGLEELVLGKKDGDWTPVVKALASLTPCALKKLETWRGQTKAGPRAFFQGLGRGAFPALISLELNHSDPDIDLVRELAAALLSLAARGTASQLKRLTIINKGLDMDCLSNLTPVLAAGGLPAMTDLCVYGGRALAVGLESGGFFDAWKTAGSQIKLESLTLKFPMSVEDEAQFLQALADPAFCPSLLECGLHGSINNPLRVAAAFATRRRLQQEAQAAAEAGVEGAPAAAADDA